MNESPIDLLWHNINSFWSLQLQDGFYGLEIFAKVFLDHLHLINKLLKCVD